MNLMKSTESSSCFVVVCPHQISIVTHVDKLRKSTIIFVVSICPSAWNSSAATGRIFIKSDIWNFFRKSVEKKQIQLNCNKNKFYSTWRPKYRYDNISLNSSYNEECVRQIWRENQNTFCFQYFFFPENRAVYEMWYSQTGHRWQYNTAHAHCVLDN